MKQHLSKLFIYFNVFLIFTHCQNSPQFIEKKSKSINESDQSNQNKTTALILYLTDSPNEFIYFSTLFTEKLNKENNFETIHNHDINQRWLQNWKNSAQNFNLDHDIEKLTEIIKAAALHESLKNLRDIYNQKVQLFNNLLKKYPSKIKNNILSAYFFWTTVTEIKLHKNYEISLYYYNKTTTLIDRNIFALEIDKETLKKIQNHLSTIELKIQFQNSKNCSLFANGILVQNNLTLLPINSQTIISANCFGEFYSKSFMPTKNKTINISELKQITQLNSMPNIETLPKKEILNENYDKIFLIFWSKESNYLDAKVLNRKNFKVIIEKKFILKNAEDSKKITTELSKFLIKNR